MNVGGLIALFASGVSFGMAYAWRTAKPEVVTEFRYLAAQDLGSMEIMNLAPPIDVLDAVTIKDISIVKEHLQADLAEMNAQVKPYQSDTDFILISHEDYLEDDEYDKITCEVFRDDLQYQLVVDGDAVIDWQTLLTAEILEDLVGKESIFLRNERKKADYEVTWGQP